MPKEHYIELLRRRLTRLQCDLTWVEQSMTSPVSAYGVSGFNQEDIDVLVTEINWTEDALEAQGCNVN